MAHDVFISYSSKDTGIAESICSALEENELRCWIAPRNIRPGVKYAAALVDAISKCKVFLLILSTASNESPQVEMEVDRAASKNIPILCFRIDRVVLSKTLEFYLSSRHWLDASKPPLEAHIQNLVRTTKQLTTGEESMPSIPVKAIKPALGVVEEHPVWKTALLAVSLGKEEVSGQAVLVIRIQKRLVPAKDFLARFEPLAKAIGRVEPGHLVKILDLGEQDGQAVVLLEAPAGKSLMELASGGDGLPMNEALDIARQLGDTLAALHKQKLLQLVFDPQAVWLSNEGLVQVSNTGIPQGANLGRLLASGKLSANSWHAPELSQDEPGDIRTDFYSLGALLHLALTGKGPGMVGPGDRTPTLAELNPSRLRPNLIPEWDELVSRCIHPNPSRRIQSVAEYMSRLEEVRSGMEMAEGQQPAGKEDSLVGQTLGGYQLVEKLGQGGMATVYKAYESMLDRYVAVKVLPTFFAGDANFTQRFKREAKAVAHLSHPNIIPIYNYGEEKGITYIVMQLMQGGTLKRTPEKVYTPEESLRMLLPVTRALAYAHQHGIVHRDIKPGNILLTEDNWPVLADFGLVQMAEASTRLTSSGVGLGTPAYMSPEQGQGGKVDQRSDVYSLAIVLYEMVTGDVPFHADTPMAVLLKHISEPIPAAHKVNPSIPGEVEAIILKAAAKNPQERYQSAEEMGAAMEQALVRITSASEKVLERKKTRSLPVPKRKEFEERQAEQKPFKPWKPTWRLRPVHMIAGGVALVLVLAGIFGARLLTSSGMPAQTANGGLPTWTAKAGATAPPTQKAAMQTAASQLSWIKVADALLGRDQVNAIAIDPSNSQVVYLGTQNSGVYKTEDGGQSWMSRGAGLRGAAISNLVMNPQEPSILYAAVVASGVYKTGDGGISWQLSQDTSGILWGNCSNLAMDPSNPERLYFSDGKNLFQTENGGDPWFTMQTNLPEGVLCNMVIPGWDAENMWGSVWDDGFYMSTDKGWNWNQWEPWKSLLPDIAPIQYFFYLDPYEDGFMYVSFRDINSSNSYLLHSVDKGTRWTSETLRCGSGMAFDRIDHQVEYCASSRPLFVTKDGGGHWELLPGFPDRQVYSLALSANNPNSIFVGSRGVIHSGDGGSSWEFQENGLGAGKFEFLLNPTDPTDLYLIEGNEDNFWTLLKGSDGTGYFDKVVFDYPGYPTFDIVGTIYISKGVELWKYNSEMNDLVFVSSVESNNEIRFVANPFTRDVLFGTGDPDYLFRSSNAGKSWEKIAIDAAGNGSLVFTRDNPEVIFSSLGEATYLSQDLGKTWSVCGEINATKPDSGTAIAVDARFPSSDSYLVYMATQGAGLMISNDGCRSWTSIKAPFRSLNLNSVVVDQNNPDTIYVGTDAGAYVSYDRGIHWNDISAGLPVGGVVYSIFVRGDGKAFAATPFGVFRLVSK